MTTMTTELLVEASSKAPVKPPYRILKSTLKMYQHLPHILYIGGSGGSGTTAEYLSQYFNCIEINYTANMADLSYEGFLKSYEEVQKIYEDLTFRGFQIGLIIGNSYGGAILYELVKQHQYNGACIFIAPAFLLARQPWYGDFSYPSTVGKVESYWNAAKNKIDYSYETHYSEVLIYHGLRDDLCPYSHSIEYIRNHPDPSKARLVLSNEDHLVSSSMFTNSYLVNECVGILSRYNNVSRPTE